MNTFFDWYFKKSVSKGILIVLAALLLGAIALLPHTKFDYHFESFFPVDDPDLDFYYNYTDRYGTDNDFVLIALVNHPSIYDSAFLAKVHHLADTLKSFPFVASVMSPTALSFPAVSDFGAINIPYLHLNEPERYAADSARIMATPWLIGNFFSTDGTALIININTLPKISKLKGDTLLDAIESILPNYQFERVHTASKLKGQRNFILKMQRELMVFISAALVILIVFLWFTFRSSYGVWVPIVVVGASIIMLLALMVLIGKSINVMTILLPTIMFVVGVSDIVHILEKYIEELRKGLEKEAALKITFKEIGMATFLTSLTTAIGFVTLLTANIQPIKEFGVLTAIGVFIAFILAFTLLPAVLNLADVPSIAEKNKGKMFWTTKLHRLFIWVLGNTKKIAVGSTVVVVISLLSISTIKVNSSFLEDWSVDEEQKDDYAFFENEFAGVRPFEMELYLKDTSETMLSAAVIADIAVIDSIAQEVFEAPFSLSIATIYKWANMAFHAGLPNQYKLPSSEEFEGINKHVKRYFKKELGNYVQPDRKTSRITFKTKDFGGYFMKQKIAEFDALVAEKLPQNHVTYKLTGMGLLIDKNNEYLSANMLNGLLIAFIIIGIIMGILFLDLKIVLIALIPNILPLLMVGGVMGLTGVDMKIATSIIFTIAFGIAVDDTIHIMSKMRIELAKGKSRLYALKRSYLSGGKAIIVTSIILSSGFFTLLLSDINSTFYTGYLVSLTLVFALIADLLLLPVLILWFYFPKQKS